MSELKHIQRLKGCWVGLSKCFIVPQRVLLAMMCFIGLMNNSLISSSTAACLQNVVVFVHFKRSARNHTHPMCAEQTDDDHSKHLKFKLVYWSVEKYEKIVTSRHWASTVTILPGAILAILTGGKHVLAVCLLIDSVVTLLTPIVVMKFDWMGILVLQVINTLAQGAVIPTIFVLVSHWMPRGERSLVTSFIFFGVPAGSTLGKVIATKLVQYSGTWDTPLYIIGIAPLLWCILWQLLCYSYPDSHPFIKDKEFYHLHGRTASRRNGFKDIPWRGILTNLPVWAYFIGDAGHDWIIHTMYYQLPTYMHSVLRYKFGFVYYLPWICLGCSALVAAAVADYFIGNSVFGVATIRKFYTGMAGVGVMICLVAVPFCECSRLCTMIMFCTTMSSVGFFYPSICINSLDLTPHYAGLLQAIMYVLSILSERLIGVFASPFPKRENFEDWRSFFWLVLLVQVVTGLIFVIWSSGDVQNFDKQDYTYVGLGRRAVAQITPHRFVRYK